MAKTAARHAKILKQRPRDDGTLICQILPSGLVTSSFRRPVGGRKSAVCVHAQSHSILLRRMPAADQPDLFADGIPLSDLAVSGAKKPTHQPLAARMRPRRLSEVVGQDHILKEGSLLPRLVAQNRF